MTTELLLSAGVLIAAGLLLLGLGSAQRRGRLRRNLFLGLRTPTTLADDRAWAAAHATTATGVITGGGILAVGGASALLIRPDDAAVAEVLLLAPAAIAAAVLLTTAYRGQLAAKRAGNQDSNTPS